MLLWTKSASPVWNNERIPLCRALVQILLTVKKIGLNTQEFLSDGWLISYVCDPAKGSVLKMGHCIINAIWRHQLFFCRNDIGSGKKDLMSHSSSMFDHTVHKRIPSRSLTFSIFPFFSSSRINVLLIFLRPSISFGTTSTVKPSFLPIVSRSCGVPLRSYPNLKSSPHCNVLRLKISHQDLFNKGFCLHMTDPVIQRTFDQHIHACFLKKLTSFLFCKDHLTADAKRKRTVCRPFSSVPGSSTSFWCPRCMPSNFPSVTALFEARKFSVDLQVFHIFCCSCKFL